MGYASTLGDSSPQRKILASVVNCTLVFAISIPLYQYEHWRWMTILLFFSYQSIFMERDVGMMVAGTFTASPTPMRGVLAYTASFSTLLLHIHFPGDLTILNGIAQILCLRFTGNTLHGLIGGYRTLSIGRNMGECDTPSPPLVRGESRSPSIIAMI